MSIGYSIMLAKMFGLYFGVMTIWLLLYRNILDSYLRDLMHHRMALYSMSIMTLILGIILIVTHSIWVFDWRLVLTILSWITFLKGCILLLANTRVFIWMLDYISIKKFFLFQLAMLIIFDVFFIYYGFIYTVPGLVGW